MSKGEISIEDVVSGQVKMEYVDQLELLKENLSSNSFLNNKSNKKELLKLVENLKAFDLILLAVVMPLNQLLFMAALLLRCIQTEETWKDTWKFVDQERRKETF